MKRKVLSLALGLCMVFSLMVTANATPSVTGDDTPEVAGVTASDGTVLAPDAVKVTTSENAAAVVEASKEAAKEVAAQTGKNLDTYVAAATSKMSLDSTAAKVIADGGTVEVALTIDGIQDGDEVFVYVVDKDGNVREVKASVKNGQVVLEIDFIIDDTMDLVVMKDEAGDGYVTSPKTSGTSLEGVLICGAVLSLAVLALCIKRSRMA